MFKYKKNGKKHCISSISCKINEDEMEISSKTHKKYEGNKYNLLLRCAVVLLAPYIKNEDVTSITKVVSRAMNPISAFSMIKYYNARNDELDEYMEDNEIEPSEITLENVTDFFDEKNELEIDEDLNDEEIDALMMENPDFGYIAILVINLNEEIIQKTKETYINTLERIGCPPSDRTGEGTKKQKQKRKSKNKKLKKTIKKIGKIKKLGKLKIISSSTCSTCSTAFICFSIFRIFIFSFIGSFITSSTTFIKAKKSYFMVFYFSLFFYIIILFILVFNYSNFFFFVTIPSVFNYSLKCNLYWLSCFSVNGTYIMWSGAF